MEIPTCVSFWALVATGAFIVPLLGLLKNLKIIGPIVEQWAWLLAPLLSALAPAVAAAATPYCAKVNPWLWIAAYAGLVYLVSQLVYWINRNFVKIGRTQ